MTIAKEIVLAFSEEALVSVVMLLTGGSANPAVVRAQIRRIREEAEQRAQVPKMSVVRPTNDPQRPTLSLEEPGADR